MTEFYPGQKVRYVKVKGRHHQSYPYLDIMERVLTVRAIHPGRETSRTITFEEITPAVRSGGGAPDGYWQFSIDHPWNKHFVPAFIESAQDMDALYG